MVKTIKTVSPKKTTLSFSPNQLYSYYNNRLAILTNLLPYYSIAVLFFFYHRILLFVCVNYSAHNPTISYKYYLSFRLISNLVIQPARTHRLAHHSKRAISHIMLHAVPYFPAPSIIFIPLNTASIACSIATNK